ncbi:hypothetical protein LCGC14_1699890 [marine sediment metagenome]|uniref:Uncharacterized protein n=1 Tax=marine sediment metagenome TaxID=412755 RepID=A0A0F9JYW4_9ZZZZ
MYDQKIKSARQIIETHNENAEEKIVFEDFKNKLQDLGGTSEDALAVCSYEDLEKCGLPRIMARQIARIFRAENGDGSNKSTYISYKKAGMMTPKELLERYNPQDVKNAVGKRLEELSGKKRCIVFKEDGSVDVKESEKLLKAIMSNFEEIDKTTTEDGRVVQIYKVGERTNFYVDMNPLYGDALRPGFICSHTSRSWEKISLIVRQLIYIANHHTQEIKISNVDDVHNVIDMASKDEAEGIFRNRYRSASLRFDEFKESGNLPTLKIKLAGAREIDKKKNNPFGSNKRF